MTTLSGPVGVRRGVTQVRNAPIDQGKIIGLLWSIDSTNGGQKGVSDAPTAGAPQQCDPDLAAAIRAFQDFLVGRGELPADYADGVVDPSGLTLRKLDARAGGVAPTPPTPEQFTDLNVLRFRQTMPPSPDDDLSYPAIEPGSVQPFLFSPPLVRNAALVEGSAVATISEFLFKIEKSGVIFWVGACVRRDLDLSRAHIFFHPDTISASDDAGYPAFTGRWPIVQRYVAALGLQMAAVKTVPLIVPFMTNASSTNDALTNLFADRGVETINDILFAIQISLGRTGNPASVQQLGVSSFSSGVNHLFRFAEKLGPAGLIVEQIDFDSAFMVVRHKNAPPLPGAANWMVTQIPPPQGARPGWLYLPPNSFRNVNAFKGDIHTQIGFLMFKTMMTLSVMR
jgi:hypothetical protein